MWHFIQHDIHLRWLAWRIFHHSITFLIDFASMDSRCNLSPNDIHISYRFVCRDTVFLCNQIPGSTVWGSWSWWFTLHNRDIIVRNYVSSANAHKYVSSWRDHNKDFVIHATWTLRQHVGTRASPDTLYWSISIVNNHISGWPYMGNSLWSNDAIWWQRSGSTLAR